MMFLSDVRQLEVKRFPLQTALTLPHLYCSAYFLLEMIRLRIWVKPALPKNTKHLLPVDVRRNNTTERARHSGISVLFLADFVFKFSSFPTFNPLCLT